MRHVVIGGGIAGVCCVEELCRLRSDDSITLVSTSTVLKGIDSVIKITKTVEEVTIRERDLATLQRPNLQVLQAVVQSIDTQHKVVHLQSGASLSYDRLCIACGARPKVLGFHHERIITLRDTQSVEDFARKLASARRIAVVGNGGIALELVGAVRDVEVVWVMKHEHIGDAFFDADAAEFLLGELQHQQRQQQKQQQQCQQKQQQEVMPPGEQAQQQAEVPTQHKQPVHQTLQQEQQQQRQPRTDGSPGSSQPAAGHRTAGGGSGSSGGDGGGGSSGGGGVGSVVSHAAGPKWVNSLPQGHLPANVRLERTAQVIGASSTPQHSQQQQQQEQQEQQQPGSPTLRPANGNGSGNSDSSDGWPLYLQLSSGDEVGVDLLVQAIGVAASTDWLPGELQRAPDGGILVGANLESVSTPGVFAAGDCCTVDPDQQSAHWFQMRLWTQARLMGVHAAACMAGADEAEAFNFSFELFTHVTRFLGRKVVLLGLYNGQKLQQQRREDMVTYSRALDEGTPSATFVRVLLLRGKMQGAVLIGDTDLEETFENLILDGLDLSQYGPALLDPDIELDHVFD